jgi:hypothetical protein
VANVNNPHGLRPLMRNFQGGRVSAEYFTKEVGYGQAIYVWDPVTLLAGVLNGPASGITPGTTRYLGVVLGPGSPASTAAQLLVVRSRDAVYECQEDASGAANVVAAKMGYNANLTTTAGDSTRLTSKVQVSGTSINTTSSLDVHIERLVNAPDNAYGANARLEIRFNKHLDNPEVTQT